MNKFTLNNLYLLFLTLFVIGCKSESPEINFQDLLTNSPKLIGKKEYLNSSFVAAGDRVYMVGHQDGTFPDLGWHVEGEMGGIWNHPIKLMDGFTNSINFDNEVICLNQADQFINYPFGNKHVFKTANTDLEVERFQFVPEGKEGLIIEFLFKNQGKEPLDFKFNFTGYVDLMPVWLGEEAGMIDHVDNLDFDQSRQAWRGKDEGNDWFVLFGEIGRAHV